MLSKELLRRRTEEAVHRIEQERLREEERLRQEVKARELEEQKNRQLKALQLRERRLAKRMVAEIFRDAVIAANRGDRGLSVPSPPHASDAVEQELRETGFRFFRTQTRGVEAHIEAHVRNFFAAVSESPIATTYLERALGALTPVQQDSTQPEEWTAEAVLDVLAELEVEGEELINERAREYLDRSLYPFLHNLPLVEPEPVLQLAWKPAALTQELVELPGHVPSWMCCTSGSWLLQRVNECASQAADAGLHEAVFEFIAVPLDEERWGGNAMSKLVYLGQPIGVTPFNTVLMRSMFKALGFETERLSSNGLEALRLSS